MQWTKMAIFNV